MSQINSILVDLDGCLAELKDSHKECFNQAILEIAGEEFVISEEDHLKTFDGKKSHEKLKILNERGMNPNLNSAIWARKQELTTLALEKLPKDENLISVFKELKKLGFNIACCSNSIRQTIEKALDKLGIREYFNLIVSNEDCISPKSHPEIFWRAMIHFKALPEETLIIEDSPVGLLAAHRSNAKVLRVKNPKDLTIEKIKNKLNMKEESKNKWVDEKLTVIIPAAGLGQRFQEAGFSFKKPLISIPNMNGKPMIQVVAENLKVEAKFVFIVLKEDYEKYNLGHFLHVICPNCEVIQSEGLTRGSAETVLLARKFLDGNENPVLLANSDQFFTPEGVEGFLYAAQERNCDASVLTFKNSNPKFSYCKVGESGYVEEVAEKTVISEHANVGIFYHKKGSDCLKYIEQMIAADFRVKNEYYYSPMLNFAIADGQKVTIYNVDACWCLGDPESLNYFINNYKQ